MITPFWFANIPLVGGLVYWVGMVVCWRMLTGHFAWEAHRSAKTNATLRPPVDNWLGCSVLAFPLALVWFIVALFAIPWPRRLTVGAEAEGEHMTRGLKRVAVEQANLQAEKGLGIGGEVVD